MKPQILMVLGILAVLVVSGCSQTGQVIRDNQSTKDENLPAKCVPDYIIASIDNNIILTGNYTEYCKSLCYKQFTTTSFKITNPDKDTPISIPFKCYCDVNKCGQVIDERRQIERPKQEGLLDIFNITLKGNGTHCTCDVYVSAKISLLNNFSKDTSRNKENILYTPTVDLSNYGYGVLNCDAVDTSGSTITDDGKLTLAQYVCQYKGNQNFDCSFDEGQSYSKIPVFFGYKLLKTDGTFEERNTTKSFSGTVQKYEFRTPIISISERIKMEFCAVAGAYIQGGIYDSGTLNILIFNNGKVPLNFVGVLSYQDGNIVVYPDTLEIVAGDTGTFTMTGVTSDLEQVTIQSKECPGVQDLLYHYNIRGLG